MNKEKHPRLRGRSLTLLWLALFAAAFAFSLWKLPYGFGGSDEGFYLTVAHRLSLGDRLFSHEWHLSQLSSFFLLPFVKAYRALAGSNEGIMLAARVAYLVMHSLVSIVIFLRLRSFGPVAAVASALYMVFTPFDMMTLSYNTIALDMLALTGVLLGTAEKGRGAWMAGGACFACAVVCCPYLAAGYALFFLAVAAFSLPKLKDISGYGFFTWRNFLMFTAGILVPFFLFVVFFLRHASLPDIIENLPGLLSDPEHPSYSLWFMAKHYVYCVLTAHSLMPVVLGLYCVHLALLFFDGKRREHKGFHFVFALFCSLFALVILVPRLTEDNYNAVAFPMVFAGFSAYLLLEKKPVELFVSCFVLGIVYSVCVSSTSNMGFLVISMAFSVVNLASLVFIGLFLAENRGRPVPALGAAMLLLLFASMLVYSKANHCFWDGAPARLDSEITAGPAKGIITSPGLEESYRLIYEDMQSYAEAEPGRLLVMSQIPWCYLIADDYPYGSFSAWLSGLDSSTVERLELYYSINPEMKPEYIHIVKSNAFGPLYLEGEAIAAGAAEHGYELEESSVSYKLRKAP